jgi:hypothetical protein
VAGYCENGNDSGSTKGEQFIDKLSGSWFLKRDSVLWNRLVINRMRSDFCSSLYLDKNRVKHKNRRLGM